MAQPSSPRKRLSNRQVFVIAIALLLVVFVGAPQVKRLIVAPWSLAGEGPTLTGTWDGQLQARQGGRYRLLLDIDYDDESRGGGRRRSRVTDRTPGDLKGTARVCTPKGEIYAYAVNGHADRSAEQVRLNLEYGDPALSALNLPLEGSWRGDVLVVTTWKNPFGPDGSFQPNRSVDSASPDDRFAPAELRKAAVGDFEAACARLAAGP
jgi:hypothetical protein